jgi:predicted ATPase/DNA-binding SARP family transcriptional activator
LTQASAPDPAGPGSQVPVAVRLLGPLDIRVHGQPLPRLRSQSGQWLLALLALRHGRAVEREWLAGTLWPESSQSQGAANLRRTLTDLRGALGPEAVRLRSPSSHALVLDLAGVSVDLLEFDAALARGDPTSVEAGIALYRGPLLEGCDEEWVLPERRAREEACLAALERLAAGAQARGDPQAAAAHLRRAAALDPLRESCQRALMQALAASGDFPAAILAYRDLRLRLHRELNAEPDPETAALFQQLRAEAREKAAATSQPSTRPAPPAPHPSGRRLPRPLTEFVGRRRDVEEITALLATSRLVTLAGPGGIGKTRLALQVAEELEGQFADGVGFVDLAPVRDAALVPLAVASTLGLRELPDRPLEEALIDSVCSRELLLLLDNCEQLADACARLAELLLSHAPRVRILATSRQALGITGETDCRVPPLAFPVESRGLAVAASTLNQYEAVQLFAQRAQAARPDFALTERNAEAVAQICRRLDGIPLALELAAARLKLLAADQIAARLDDRFQLLTSGSRTALPRQRTLRATLDWSYELLDERERGLLRQLSVFPGRFSLETAEKVCGSMGEVLDLLGQLVDKSLVSVEEQAGEARYHLLETTREYAREQAAAMGEEAALRQRHAEYFLALAESAVTMLNGPEAAGWLDRLEAVDDNLRAAMGWWTDGGTGTTAEQGLRMGAALWQFWRARYIVEGEGAAEAVAWTPAVAWAEVVRWIERLLAHTPPCSRAAAEGLHLLSRVIRWGGVLARARSLAEQSLAIYERLEDREGSGTVLVTLAIIRREQGDAEAAQRLLVRSLALHREVGNRAGVGHCLAHLGVLAYQRGDYAAARALHEENLALQREIGSPRGTAFALRDLGLTVQVLGDYRTAHAAHAESLEIWERLRHRINIAWSCANLAETTLELGDATTARAFGRRALAIFGELHDRRGIMHSLVTIAGIALRDAAGARKAATLLAAAQGIFGAAPIYLQMMDHAEFERLVAACRGALREASFRMAWEEGCAMSLEQAVACGLEEDAVPGASPEARTGSRSQHRRRALNEVPDRL